MHLQAVEIPATSLHEEDDVDVGDPIFSETAQIVGGVIGAIAAGGVTAVSVFRHWAKGKKAEEAAATPPAPVLLEDARAQLAEAERARLQGELIQRIYDLTVEEQLSRVDERRRDEKIAHMAELLDQLYIRDQRTARTVEDRTRQLEDQLARMERMLHDLRTEVRHRHDSEPPR